MITIKEGDYISARVDKDLTIEGYVILEDGNLVLQESDFQMTISINKLTEIKLLPHVQN